MRDIRAFLTLSLSKGESRDHNRSNPHIAPKSKRAAIARGPVAGPAVADQNFTDAFT